MIEYLVIIGLLVLGLIITVQNYGGEIERIILGNHQKGQFEELQETMETGTSGARNSTSYSVPGEILR